MRFEDLDVWSRAKDLSVEIYRQTAKLRDYGFRDQITRSGLSISSNVAEGYERQSIRECLNFLSYAKGSCGELRTQVQIGKEIGYIIEQTADRWTKEAIEISSMLHALMQSRKKFIV